MNDEKKPFTVSDRRHFTAEGQSRHDEPTEAEPTEAKATEPEATEPETAEPETAKAKATEGEARPEGAAGGDPEVTLTGFLTGLAAQAAMLMGAPAGTEGEAEAPAPDLPSARHVIGILEMLRDKTEGRRTPE